MVGLPKIEVGMSYTPQVRRHLRTIRHIAAGGGMNWTIEPLGVWQNHIFLKDAAGVIHAMHFERLQRKRIEALFRHDKRLLINCFPSTWARGWNHQHAQECIMCACATRGPVEPERLGFTAIYRRKKGQMPTVSLVPKARLTPP